MKYNETYESTHHKYTMNLPLGLIQEARTKGKEAGYAELAPYLRHVILREVRGGNINIQDILGEKEVRRREYLTKQRRDSKFVKLPTKNFLDKIRSLSVYFKSSKDQQFFEF